MLPLLAPSPLLRPYPLPLPLLRKSSMFLDTLSFLLLRALLAFALICNELLCCCWMISVSSVGLYGSDSSALIDIVDIAVGRSRTIKITTTSFRAQTGPNVSCCLQKISWLGGEMSDDIRHEVRGGYFFPDIVLVCICCRVPFRKEGITLANRYRERRRGSLSIARIQQSQTRSDVCVNTTRRYRKILTLSMLEQDMLAET